MSDAQVIAPEPVAPEAPDAAEAMGQTTLEHDGRVFTGTDTDADATEAASLPKRPRDVRPLRCRSAEGRS